MESFLFCLCSSTLKLGLTPHLGLLCNVLHCLFFQCIFQGTHISVRGSLGMKVGENGKDLSSSSISLSVPEAKPFETVSTRLTLKADLAQTKDGLLSEHRVSQVSKSYFHYWIDLTQGLLQNGQEG